ncbi:MAG: hypothetical protein ACM3PX_05440 [Omnitrophica WOR_2 bacterium]
MKNLRVILIVAISLTIAIFIGSALRSWYLFLKEPVSPIVDALPSNTAVVLKTKSIFKLFDAVKKSSLGNLFNKEGEFRVINNYLDTIVTRNTKFSKILESSDVWFAFAGDKGHEPGLLILTSVGKTSASSINNQLEKLLNNDKFSITKTDNLYLIDNGKSHLWYFIRQGIFAISNDSSVITKSINTLTAKNQIPLSKSFNKLLSTGGKQVDANLLINNRIFTSLIWPEKELSLSKGTPFDDWTSFDITIKKGKILLGGFTYSASEHLFTGQQPVEYNPIEDYPDNTAFALTTLISDEKLFIGKIFKADTLHVQGFDASINQNTSEVFRPDEHIRSWISNSVSLIYTNDYFRGYKSSRMIKIGNRDKDSAQYYLRPYIEPLNDSLGILHYSSMAADLWGEMFSMRGTVYCLITSKYVTLSPNKDLLISTLNSSTARSKDILAARENADKGSNLSIYLKPGIVSQWFTKSTKSKDNDLLAFLSKNSSIGIQYSAGDELQYTHAWILPDSKHATQFAMSTKENLSDVSNLKDESSREDLNANKKQENLKEKEKTDVKKDESSEKEISVKAETYPPQIVSGSQSSQKRIALLTKKGKLYMYDHQGELLWDVNLSGKPSSPVMEADYKKNGSTYYIVTSGKKLHIIDPSGKEIKESPYTLPQPVLGEISILDYDNKRDYRLLYVGSDHMIYNITLKGKELPDWKKPSVSGNGKITFFRTNGKDYLVYQYKNETLKIFDRRGKERIKLSSTPALSEKATLFENKTNSKGIFVTISNDGKLTYINNNGLISTSSFENIGNNPWFLYNDLDSDGSMDFIFTSNDRIVAYNKMKDPIVNMTIKNGKIGKPFLYSSTKRDKWIFVRNTQSGEIIGINNSGKTIRKSIQSETDPLVFTPGGGKKEILVTTLKSKLVLTELNNL